MREIGEKLAANAFQFLQLRDVKKDANGKSLTEWRDIKLKASRLKVCHFDAHLCLSTVIERATKSLMNCRIPGDFDKPLRWRCLKVISNRKEVIATGILLVACTLSYGFR